MKYPALCILLVAFLSGCNSSPAIDVMNRAVQVREHQRNYRLVVPREWEPDSPLVIAWHGFGDTAEGMANYSRLDHLAAKHQFVLVYPESNGNWQVPMAGGQSEKLEMDLLFFDALVEEAADGYAIDRRRVYVVGMSQGATFVHWLANQRAQKIAAAVAYAGSPSSGWELDSDGPPVLLICGTEDLALDTMKKAQLAYRDARGSADLVPLDGVGHKWSPRINETLWQFFSQHRATSQ